MADVEGRGRVTRLNPKKRCAKNFSTPLSLDNKYLCLKNYIAQGVTNDHYSLD